MATDLSTSAFPMHLSVAALSAYHGLPCLANRFRMVRGESLGALADAIAVLRNPPAPGTRYFAVAHAPSPSPLTAAARRRHGGERAYDLVKIDVFESSAALAHAMARYQERPEMQEAITGVVDLASARIWVGDVASIPEEYCPAILTFAHAASGIEVLADTMSDNTHAYSRSTDRLASSGDSSTLRHCGIEEAVVDDATRPSASPPRGGDDSDQRSSTLESAPGVEPPSLASSSGATATSRHRSTSAGPLSHRYWRDTWCDLSPAPRPQALIIAGRVFSYEAEPLHFITEARNGLSLQWPAAWLRGGRGPDAPRHYVYQHRPWAPTKPATAIVPFLRRAEGATNRREQQQPPPADDGDDRSSWDEAALATALSIIRQTGVLPGNVRSWLESRAAARPTTRGGTSSASSGHAAADAAQQDPSGSSTHSAAPQSGADARREGGKPVGRYCCLVAFAGTAVRRRCFADLQKIGAPPVVGDCVVVAVADDSPAPYTAAEAPIDHRLGHVLTVAAWSRRKSGRQVGQRLSSVVRMATVADVTDGGEAVASAPPDLFAETAQLVSECAPPTTRARVSRMWQALNRRATIVELHCPVRSNADRDARCSIAATVHQLVQQRNAGGDVLFVAPAQ
eukprot:CAMPEP_0174835162 /NCGR_PEP_ID=MMETSP1114-20130205/5265_1 /TAXON_ID=312471 /ORGANISM="Neobodo designis, Strain CCAP 1951/1" /LENGTH=625 /DNA_ID=CAMNT_0016069107 /DNA_START=54 /DNA_END=1931 /DNA_ORIENTATION=+